MSNCCYNWEQCSAGAVKHWHQADSPTVEANSWNVAPLTVYLRDEVGAERERGREVQPADEIRRESRQGGFVCVTLNWFQPPVKLDKERPALPPDLGSAGNGSAAPTHSPRGRGANRRISIWGHYAFYWSDEQFILIQFLFILCEEKMERKRKFFLLLFDE